MPPPSHHNGSRWCVGNEAVMPLDVCDSTAAYLIVGDADGQTAWTRRRDLALYSYILRADKVQYGQFTARDDLAHRAEEAEPLRVCVTCSTRFDMFQKGRALQ